MRAPRLAAVVCALFASGLAGCGSMGPGPLAGSSSTSVRSDGGLSSDSGVRWLGAEPLGALVAETAPRGAQPPPPPPPAEPGSEGSGPARRPFGIGARGVAPSASATAGLPSTATLPASAPSALRPPPPPSRLRTPPPPPPPSLRRAPPPPPPPGSQAAALTQVPAAPGTPPATAGASAQRPPIAIPTPPPLPAPVRYVQWPEGQRNPNAPADESASLEAPPSGTLPPPVVPAR